MTHQDLFEFLDRFGMSQIELARRLEVSRNTVAAYLTGRQAIPKIFELALEEVARQERRK